MKKTIATLLTLALVASFSIPAVAGAAGGPGSGKGKSGTRMASTATRGTKTSGAKQARVQAKTQAKQAGVEARKVRKQAHASRVASPSAEATPSAETTKAVGHGVVNALQHITSNIQRKIAKFGWDARLPMGLMSTWLKFSTWLGNDTSVMPWVAPVSNDTSPTPAPSGDASPTPSGDQTPSVDPSTTVVPAVL